MPCAVTLTQKEFGRPASSGEQNPNEDRANTPRRAPRSRHRNSKLSAAPPNAPGTGLVGFGHGVEVRRERLGLPDGDRLVVPGRSGRCSIRCASSCLWTWRSRSASRESGVSGPLIRGGVVDRCRASNPTMRHQSIGGCSAERGQWRSASVRSRRSTPAPASWRSAENSDPRVASDRGRQQSYPVSRPLAHRLHSSHHAAFEAVLMSCRVVGKLRWPGRSEVVMGMPSAARHTARSPGRATSGRPLSPRPT